MDAIRITFILTELVLLKKPDINEGSKCSDVIKIKNQDNKLDMNCIFFICLNSFFFILNSRLDKVKWLLTLY